MKGVFSTVVAAGLLTCTALWSQCTDQTTLENITDNVIRTGGNQVFSFSQSYVTGDYADVWTVYAAAQITLNGNALHSGSDTEDSGNTAEVYWYDALSTTGPGTFAEADQHRFTNPCGTNDYYTYNDRSLTVSKPTLTGPNNTTSAAFWYLNGAPSIDGYYVQWGPFTANPNWPGQNPTVTWSTDTPGKLMLTVDPSTLTATATSTGASSNNSGTYDIHITVSLDGFNSDPFPIYIDTPYGMTTSIAGDSCSSISRPDPGYVTDVSHGIYDLIGYTLVPITTNESLEKIQLINGYSSNNSNWNLNIAQGVWDPGDWITVPSKFIDNLWACGSLTPTPQSYNESGTNAVVNETQKFWVGSSSQFSGTCTQRGVVTLFTDHGAVTPYYTPITNQGDCAQGTVLN